MTDPLMAGNEWQARLNPPVTFRGMQVGVTDTAGLDLHQYLVGRDVRHIPLLDSQGGCQIHGRRRLSWSGACVSSSRQSLLGYSWYSTRLGVSLQRHSEDGAPCENVTAPPTDPRIAGTAASADYEGAPSLALDLYFRLRTDVPKGESRAGAGQRGSPAPARTDGDSNESRADPERGVSLHHRCAEFRFAFG